MESIKEKEKGKLIRIISHIILAAVFIISCIACYSPRTAAQIEIRKYQAHKKHEDTSIVYELPYKPNTRHRIIQGYFSRYTHKYKAAVDFKMKKGTPILSVRDGKVIRVKDDSNVGGWNKKYRPDANFIVIEHPDSTRSSYRHLLHKGVLVQAGDQVYQGQVIGYSGNTGYTMSPHLHFMITKYEFGQWVTIPCRFRSKDNVGYVKPLRLYTSVNTKSDQQPASKSEQEIAN